MPRRKPEFFVFAECFSDLNADVPTAVTYGQKAKKPAESKARLSRAWGASPIGKVRQMRSHLYSRLMAAKAAAAAAPTPELADAEDAPQDAPSGRRTPSHRRAASIPAGVLRAPTPADLVPAGVADNENTVELRRLCDSYNLAVVQGQREIAHDSKKELVAREREQTYASMLSAQDERRQRLEAKTRRQGVLNDNLTTQRVANPPRIDDTLVGRTLGKPECEAPWIATRFASQAVPPEELRRRQDWYRGVLHTKAVEDRERARVVEEARLTGPHSTSFDSKYHTWGLPAPDGEQEKILARELLSTAAKKRQAEQEQRLSDQQTYADIAEHNREKWMEELAEQQCARSEALATLKHSWAHNAEAKRKQAMAERSAVRALAREEEAMRPEELIYRAMRKPRPQRKASPPKRFARSHT